LLDAARDDVDEDIAVVDDLERTLEVVVSHGNPGIEEGLAGLVLDIMFFASRFWLVRA
jgi:hypothetical protein